MRKFSDQRLGISPTSRGDSSDARLGIHDNLHMYIPSTLVCSFEFYSSQGSCAPYSDPAINPKIMKFEWSPVGNGKDNHTCTIPPSGSSYRRLTKGHIDLAGPSGALPRKADRKPGWNKPRPCDAADAGELGYAAGPAGAGPDVTPRTASRRSLSSASSAPAASTGPAAPWSFLCAYASAAAGCWRGRCGGGGGRLHGRGRGGDPPATAGPEGAATAAMPNAAPPGTASEGAGIP